MIRLLSLLMIASGLPALAAAAALEGNPACAAAMALLDEATRGEQGRAALQPAPSAATLQHFIGPDGTILAERDEDGGSNWFTIQNDRPVAVSPPASETISAFAAARPASVAECVDFLREAQARGLRLAGENEKPRLRGEFYKVRMQTVGLPVVSPDGSEALAYVDSTSGPLAGGGFLVLLRRAADGVWRIAGRRLLWVS